MNRLILTPFFTAIINQQNSEIEKTFEEFTSLLIEVNDCQEFFTNKYRILNYTKTRLISLREVLTDPSEAEKKCDNCNFISYQRYCVN